MNKGRSPAIKTIIDGARGIAWDLIRMMDGEVTAATLNDLRVTSQQLANILYSVKQLS